MLPAIRRYENKENIMDYVNTQNKIIPGPTPNQILKNPTYSNNMQGSPSRRIIRSPANYRSPNQSVELAMNRSNAPNNIPT